MNQNLTPSQPEYLNQFKSQIALDIILSILTCGIYGFFWQYRHMELVNHLIGENKYSFWRWFFFCLLTCGIYHLYHEYVMGRDIMCLQDKYQLLRIDSLPTVSLVFSLFALGIVADAIHQYEMNIIIDKLLGNQIPHERQKL